MTVAVIVNMRLFMRVNVVVRMRETAMAMLMRAALIARRRLRMPRYVKLSHD